MKMHNNYAYLHMWAYAYTCTRMIFWPSARAVAFVLPQLGREVCPPCSIAAVTPAPLLSVGVKEMETTGRCNDTHSIPAHDKKR